jgi:hypothetical protein
MTNCTGPLPIRGSIPVLTQRRAALQGCSLARIHYLIEMGLLDIPILYLSRHIIDNKAHYYSGLKQITECQT